jgi:hypothetical protein
MLASRLRQGSRFASWKTSPISGCGPVMGCRRAGHRPPRGGAGRTSTRGAWSCRSPTADDRDDPVRAHVEGAVLQRHEVAIALSRGAQPRGTGGGRRGPLGRARRHHRLERRDRDAGGREPAHRDALLPVGRMRGRAGLQAPARPVPRRRRGVPRAVRAPDRPGRGAALLDLDPERGAWRAARGRTPALRRAGLRRRRRARGRGARGHLRARRVLGHAGRGGAGPPVPLRRAGHGLPGAACSTDDGGHAQARGRVPRPLLNGSHARSHRRARHRRALWCADHRDHPARQRPRPRGGHRADGLDRGIPRRADAFRLALRLPRHPRRGGGGHGLPAGAGRTGEPAADQVQHHGRAGGRKLEPLGD